MRTYQFTFNERLGISLPILELEWEQYLEGQQVDILCQWEQIRGRIPERIMQFEKEIMVKQEQLNNEENFPKSCRLNTEIAEFASCINDLNLWFRINQNISAKKHL